MKILIDLSILKNPNCGLGQVALNYGYYYRDSYEPINGEQIFLLVPKNYVGLFGEKVKYIVAKKIYRIFPFLIGIKFDVWHAIHQLSRYKPYAKHYVLTIHDFNFVYEKSDNRSKVNKYLKKIQSKAERADKIVCISNFAKQETEKYLKLKGKTISVIYNGIERIDLQSGMQLHNVKTPYFFSIGEIKEKKNFHVLLDVMKLLPDYELYIAGNKSTAYAEQIENRIKQENISNVHLVGLVSQSEKVWLYENCSAFLFPSLFEGFGLPIVEAMLFKKAVVSSDRTSLPEIGKNYVAYFPHDFDAAKSAEIIKRTITEQNQQKMQSEFDYAASFSWKSHLNQYISLYRSLGLVTEENK